jgi:curved DNA-binding protein
MTMEFKDYYTTLEVSDTATPEEIKKSYKRLARKYHPDVSKEENAEARFKEVAEAYEVLKDATKRQEYDQLKAMGARGQGGRFTPPPGWESATHYYDGGGHSDFSDFFEAMFGRDGGFHHGRAGSQHVHMRGEDVHAELALLLEEAGNGCEQVLQVRVPEVDERGLISHRVKKLKVKVPPGTAGGSILRMKGQGAPGIGGGGPGDLLVRITLAPHPLFSVDGRQLSLVVPLLPWEAALGCKVTIPTLKGKTRVSIPAGSQTGQKLRLAGLGLPGDPPGDLLAVLKVVMPDTANDAARDLYRQLQEQDASNPRAAWEEQ